MKIISKMTLGTVQLGMDYGINNTTGKPDMKAAHEILRTALQNGITSLDTANAYGDSENVIGSYLKQSNDSPFITTKFFTTSPPGKKSEDIEKEIYGYVENSLQRLNVRKLDCLMLHRAIDMTLHGRAVRNTLQKLINENYINLAGVSVYNPEDINTMLEDDIYQAIQIPINILDQRLVKTDMINRLKEKAITVFARSIFFQGLFYMDSEKMTDEDMLTYIKPYLKKLNEISEKYGISKGQMAVSYIRDLKGITSLVLGVDTKEQLKQNIQLMKGPKLKKETIEEIHKVFSDVNIPKILQILSRPKQKGQK
ncbi:MAG: aldo/keto reductase [Clostridia bacterium]|nr:aldo/keto reductase [Clostridia bacterium]